MEASTSSLTDCELLVRREQLLVGGLQLFHRDFGGCDRGPEPFAHIDEAPQDERTAFRIEVGFVLLEVGAQVGEPHKEKLLLASGRHKRFHLYANHAVELRHAKNMRPSDRSSGVERLLDHTGDVGTEAAIEIRRQSRRMAMFGGSASTGLDFGHLGRGPVGFWSDDVWPDRIEIGGVAGRCAQQLPSRIHDQMRRVE